MAMVNAFSSSCLRRTHGEGTLLVLHAKLCKTLQDPARLCKTLQESKKLKFTKNMGLKHTFGITCKILQDALRFSKIMHNSAKLLGKKAWCWSRSVTPDIVDLFTDCPLATISYLCYTFQQICSSTSSAALCQHICI